LTGKKCRFRILLAAVYYNNREKEYTLNDSKQIKKYKLYRHLNKQTINYKVRSYFIYIVAILGLRCVTLSADTEVLFSVDFEDGLNAVGADPSLPIGIAGSGCEIVKKEFDTPQGTVLNQRFPAQGKSCLQLGHFARWHIDQPHISTGCLSFWIMPMTLPSKDAPPRLFVWGGDASTKYRTFKLQVDVNGSILANYYSWQNNKSWLKGVTSSTGVKVREWNHVAFTWGTNGQRIYINGKLAGSNNEQFPMSFLRDVKFGGVAAYLDGIELSTSEEVKMPVRPDTHWQPTSSIQKDLLDIERDARKLVTLAPKGSDAHCRGLVISYSAKLAWGTVLQEPPSELTLDNIAWMKQALAETSPTLRKGEIPVPAFDINKPIVLKEGRIMQDGRPVFLLGNFSSTPVDNSIGFNICNALMPGPKNVMPVAQSLGDRGSGVVTSIDKAYANNKVINLLLSLSVPRWIYKMDSSVFESGAGWFKYNIESPAVTAMFEAAAEVVMPAIKGHGKNVLVNLGNETAYSGYSPTTTAPHWRAWLMAKHGTIAKLNEVWVTEYASFLDINGPENVKAGGIELAAKGALEIPTDPAVMGQWYDWCLFNQQRYATFIEQLRDNLKSYRSDLLFNIKWLSNFPLWWRSIGYALNPYDVTKVCDFAGCDAWTVYSGRDQEFFWGIRWEGFATIYDLLKSIAPEKPIINSENHLLRGYSKTAPPLRYGTYRDVLPWQFFYTAVWEQAIHGGSAGEFWTYWERSKGFNLDERAKAMDAMSQAARDLQRYAVEVTALANDRPRIAVLLSSAALAWRPIEHTQTSVLAYMAMNQLGLPVGYMLEEMLPDKAMDHYDVLVIPQAQHISRKMNNAINQFVADGKLVIVMGDRPSDDEYGKPLDFTTTATVWPEMKRKSDLDWWADPPENTIIKKLQHKLANKFATKGIQPLVVLKDNDDIPYGIEWRSLMVNDKLVINICNFSNRSQKMKLTVGGKPYNGVDLLSGHPMHGSLNLKPLQVVLLRSE